MKLKVQLCNEKGLRNALRITFHVGGAKALRRSRPGSSCYKMWVGLNGFDPNWLWGMKRATLLSRNPLCWQFEHIPDIVLPMATYQSLGEESSVSPHCFPETLGTHIPNVLLPTTEMKGRSCLHLGSGHFTDRYLRKGASCCGQA